MNKTVTISVTAAAVIIGAVALWFASRPVIEDFFSCARANYPILETFPRMCVAKNKNFIEPITMPAEFKIEDLEIGDGKIAEPGNFLTVHYIGTLANGKKFDSSLDRGPAFQFPLGAGQVIRGWDLGMVGMKVGGIRKLTIPPELGYGDRSIGIIPPNSTLIFEVKLLDVAKE